MTKTENTSVGQAIEDEHGDMCPGCGFNKFADEALCFTCRRSTSTVIAEEAAGPRKADNYCPHCGRNVFLLVVMAYLYGIELEPVRPVEPEQPAVTGDDTSAEAHWLREAAYGSHACPSGHEHAGPDNMCAECEHRQCCANAAE